MEYAAGGNLKDAIPELDWVEKKRIIVEVATGLAFLHSQGILHRDIKCENILLTEQRQAKLCDFGLAKIMTLSASTGAGNRAVKGTMGYIAPELIHKGPLYSTKSDIYALGVVMKRIGAFSMANNDMPLDYTSLMDQCLHEDPEKRPSANDVARAFEYESAHSIHHSLPASTTILNADEQYSLGKAYCDGFRVDRNYAEAWQRFMFAANMGHVGAQFELGMMYFRGIGTCQSYEDALKWLKQAADQGHNSARNNLAYYYRSGVAGVPSNNIEAAQLFLSAAVEGNILAQINAGRSFEYGQGVDQNHKEAFKWYQKASESGDALAQYHLGTCYYFGQGVAEDYVRASQLWQKAADGGNDQAQYNLGQIFFVGRGVSQDFQKAASLCSKAATQGHMDAQYNLAVSYLKGMGISKDENIAKSWLKSAADQGHIGAQRTLAMMDIGIQERHAMDLPENHNRILLIPTLSKIK
ncbi:hypothetical protein BGZ80_003365 [Entomortierella chlamydospora]|uniref:Protein kinase domain-containing protein n=1 Tax=Entomortierella chlamydospora TaxID=101097 RepID=A0A9P6MNM7_9FUNG|nr:hypothetical protein BGZ79_002688 [Entomortierella chlamydospora]KAG0008503.1 hypothetical protein BGZ80_003365 [Entomortierella chlamydospora]